VQWRHRPGRTYANRSRANSFLWTTIRHPVERAVSTIFYHNISRRRVTQQNNIPDEDIIEQLQWSTKEHGGAVSQGQGGFQLRYISFGTYITRQRDDDDDTNIQGVVIHRWF